MTVFPFVSAGSLSLAADPDAFAKSFTYKFRGVVNPVQKQRTRADSLLLRSSSSNFPTEVASVIDQGSFYMSTLGSFDPFFIVW